MASFREESAGGVPGIAIETSLAALGFAFAGRTKASVPTREERTSVVTQKLSKRGITS